MEALSTGCAATAVGTGASASERSDRMKKDYPEYTNSQITAIIDDVIHSERDREILKRRLIDGKIYDDLAYEFNISERSIKSIIYKGQERVFKHLESSR